MNTIGFFTNNHYLRKIQLIYDRMVIETNISAQNNIFECLSAVFDMIHRIQETEDKEILLDLSKVTATSPAFSLPLSVFLASSEKTLGFQLSKEMENVYFSEGIQAGKMRLSSFRAQMQAYTSMDYLPIVVFPTSHAEEDLKDSIQSIVENVLIEQIDNTRNVASGLRYVIGECVDNITQHAKSEWGYIAAATNKEKRYIDICIADQGITLLGSYKENNDMDIITDMEALKAANRGISTKNLPNAENRGYGIITSKKMLTDGLGGLFIMMSGSAMLIKSENLNEYVELPENLSCKGTIVICHMPFDNKDFNYINYVE